MIFKEKFLEWWIRPEGYYTCRSLCGDELFPYSFLRFA